MTSLRRRLLVVLLSLFTVTWLVLALMSFQGARRETEELFDAQLAQSARVLLDLIVHELHENESGELGTPIVGLAPGHAYEEKIAFQIWQRDRLLLRSLNAPGVPMSTATGYSDRLIADNEWRVFTLVEPQNALRIEVGERYDVRNDLIYDILLHTLWPVLIALPLLVLMTGTGIQRGLAPLEKVAAEIMHRTPHELQPLHIAGIPTEIRPLAESLNDLLARLRRAFEGERRFTADAAHELRTPLAGLKTQTQVALRATGADERTRALRQIERGVDRATRLVAQLLVLARLDPEHAGTAGVEVDLAALAAEVIAELAPSALEKHIDIGLAERGRAGVRGQPEALAILIRNLVDNAIRYTPAHGRVEVSAGAGTHAIELAVCDSGPGIPVSERARVFDRFYRVPGSTAPGCGLGLSIVQRIAEQHGAEIELESAAAGGLRVVVRFPVPAAPRAASEST